MNKKDYIIYIDMFKNYKHMYDDSICLLMFKKIELKLTRYIII